MDDYAEHIVRIRNTIPKLEEALAGKNWKEARRLAHGISYDSESVILKAIKLDIEEQHG